MANDGMTPPSAPSAPLLKISDKITLDATGKISIAAGWGQIVCPRCTSGNFRVLGSEDKTTLLFVCTFCGGEQPMEIRHHRVERRPAGRRVV